jgi:hypothetical protein
MRVGASIKCLVLSLGLLLGAAGLTGCQLDDSSPEEDDTLDIEQNIEPGSGLDGRGDLDNDDGLSGADDSGATERTGGDADDPDLFEIEVDFDGETPPGDDKIADPDPHPWTGRRDESERDAHRNAI